MSSFETLEAVAQIYGLPLEKLLGELETAVAGPPAGEPMDEPKGCQAKEGSEMSSVGEAIREHHRESAKTLSAQAEALVGDGPAANPTGLSAAACAVPIARGAAKGGERDARGVSGPVRG